MDIRVEKGDDKESEDNQQIDNDMQMMSIESSFVDGALELGNDPTDRESNNTTVCEDMKMSVKSVESLSTKTITADADGIAFQWKLDNEMEQMQKENHVDSLVECGEKTPGCLPCNMVCQRNEDDRNLKSQPMSPEYNETSLNILSTDHIIADTERVVLQWKLENEIKAELQSESERLQREDMRLKQIQRKVECDMLRSAASMEDVRREKEELERERQTFARQRAQMRAELQSLQEFKVNLLEQKEFEVIVPVQKEPSIQLATGDQAPEMDPVKRNEDGRELTSECMTSESVKCLSMDYIMVMDDAERIENEIKAELHDEDVAFGVRYGDGPNGLQTTMVIHAQFIECPITPDITFSGLTQILIDNSANGECRGKSFRLMHNNIVFYFMAEDIQKRNEILSEILMRFPENDINRAHWDTIESATGEAVLELNHDEQRENETVSTSANDEQCISWYRYHSSSIMAEIQQAKDALDIERQKFAKQRAQIESERQSLLELQLKQKKLGTMVGIEKEPFIRSVSGEHVVEVNHVEHREKTADSLSCERVEDVRKLTTEPTTEMSSEYKKLSLKCLSTDPLIADTERMELQWKLENEMKANLQSERERLQREDMRLKQIQRKVECDMLRSTASLEDVRREKEELERERQTFVRQRAQMRSERQSLQEFKVNLLEQKEFEVIVPVQKESFVQLATGDQASEVDPVERNEDDRELTSECMPSESVQCLSTDHIMVMDDAERIENETKAELHCDDAAFGVRYGDGPNGLQTFMVIHDQFIRCPITPDITFSALTQILIDNSEKDENRGKVFKLKHNNIVFHFMADNIGKRDEILSEILNRFPANDIIRAHWKKTIQSERGAAVLELNHDDQRETASVSTSANDEPNQKHDSDDGMRLKLQPTKSEDEKSTSKPTKRLLADELDALRLKLERKIKDSVRGNHSNSKAKRKTEVEFEALVQRQREKMARKERMLHSKQERLEKEAERLKHLKRELEAERDKKKNERLNSLKVKKLPQNLKGDRKRGPKRDKLDRDKKRFAAKRAAIDALKLQQRNFLDQFERTLRNQAMMKTVRRRRFPVDAKRIYDDLERQREEQMREKVELESIRADIQWQRADLKHKIQLHRQHRDQRMKQKKVRWNLE